MKHLNIIVWDRGKFIYSQQRILRGNKVITEATDQHTRFWKDLAYVRGVNHLSDLIYELDTGDKITFICYKTKELI